MTEKPEDYVMDFQIEKGWYQQFREIQGWQWIRTIVYVIFLFQMYGFMTNWAYKDANLGQAFKPLIDIALQCRKEASTMGFAAISPSCEVRVGDTQIYNYGRAVLNGSNVNLIGINWTTYS